MFSQPVLITLGTMAAVINFIAFLPYIRDIIRHKTKPQRATWWIWFFLDVVLLAAQWAAGATWSLGLIIGQVIIAGIIAVLSLRFGYGKFETRDSLSLIVAGIGIGLWAVTKNPIVALLIAITVDSIGALLTANKSWHSPTTETPKAWAISVIANLMGVLAIGSWSFSEAVYPIYSLLANTTITAIILLRMPPNSKTLV